MRGGRSAPAVPYRSLLHKQAGALFVKLPPRAEQGHHGHGAAEAVHTRCTPPHTRTTTVARRGGHRSHRAIARDTIPASSIGGGGRGPSPSWTPSPVPPLPPLPTAPTAPTATAAPPIPCPHVTRRRRSRSLSDRHRHRLLLFLIALPPFSHTRARPIPPHAALERTARGGTALGGGGSAQRCSDRRTNGGRIRGGSPR